MLTLQRQSLTHDVQMKPVANCKSQGGADIGRDDQPTLSSQHDRGIHVLSVPHRGQVCHASEGLPSRYRCRMSSERYTYLGPEGTFAEAALLTIPGAREAELPPSATVPAALDAVRRGEADGALVPLENSVEGAVPTTLDELANGEPLHITREVLLPVSFALMAAGWHPARRHPYGRHPPARRVAVPQVAGVAPARGAPPTVALDRGRGSLHRRR